MTDENTQKDEKIEETPTETPAVETPATEETAPEAPAVEAVASVAEEVTAPAETPTEEMPAEVTADEPALPAQAGEEVKNYNDLRPGMTVRVHQKIKELNTKGEEKERVQVYEGMIIARRHGTEVGSTITVRKIASGVGVEKIFPLNSPTIAKIEAVKQAQVRRAKLHYLKNWGKKLKETILKK